MVLTEAQTVVLRDLANGGYILSDGRTYARWCWVYDLKEPYIMPTFKALRKRGFIDSKDAFEWYITEAGLAAI